MRNKGLMLASVMLVVLASVAVGAGSFAYFSDVETSTDNTFTTGTLDMVLSNDDITWADGVTATWTSPPDWLPGDEFSAILYIKNIGSIGSENIFIKPVDIVEDDGGTPESEPVGSLNDLASQIIITDFTVTVIGPGGWSTGNLANSMATWCIWPYGGPCEPPLTLAEFASGPYKFWVFGSTDSPYILKAYGVTEVEVTMTFKFDPDADNNYQGETCSFTLKVVTFNGPPAVGVIVWESGSPPGYGYGN